MINSNNQTTPVEPEWQKRVERIRNRIMADPNERIASYELNLKFVSTPAAVGALLVQLAHVIEGAKGEARTHRRKVALGSLHYAVATELEDEVFRTPSGLLLG